MRNRLDSGNISEACVLLPRMLHGPLALDTEYGTLDLLSNEPGSHTIINMSTFADTKLY